MPTPSFSPLLPAVLTVAGSDNSAGAGIQADLKTFTSLGCYGLTALTSVVAEVPGKVFGIQAVETDLVRQQVELCLHAFPVQALKTGMLYSREIIEVIASLLHAFEGPIVIDPVMVATSGDRLLQQDAIHAYESLLFPLADLITPNLDEAAVLAGEAISEVEAMEVIGLQLARRYGTAILMKGGHLRSSKGVDLLIREGEVSRFETEVIEGVLTHGTGCTFSAAITGFLGHGKELAEAVGLAKDYVTEAIRNSFAWSRPGERYMALDHRIPRL